MRLPCKRETVVLLLLRACIVHLRKDEPKFIRRNVFNPLYETFAHVIAEQKEESIRSAAPCIDEGSCRMSVRPSQILFSIGKVIVHYPHFFTIMFVPVKQMLLFSSVHYASSVSSSLPLFCVTRSTLFVLTTSGTVSTKTLLVLSPMAFGALCLRWWMRL